MTTEMLPQCVDYQQAIFETLRRIEQLLSKNEPPVRSMSFSGVLIMEETVNALRVSRSTVKQLMGSELSFRGARRAQLQCEQIQR
jgi:hypothetical protein